eukprot:6083947-Pyramimonas_sp.AAC.1
MIRLACALCIDCRGREGPAPGLCSCHDEASGELGVDVKGYIVDVKGYSVDAKGYMVDVKGYCVDAKGYRVIW